MRDALPSQLWDVRSMKRAGGVASASAQPLRDCDFASNTPHVLSTVGDDQQLRVWDLRSCPPPPPPPPPDTHAHLFETLIHFKQAHVRKRAQRTADAVFNRQLSPPSLRCWLLRCRHVH